MAKSNVDLVEAFVNGETSGKASNMEIVRGKKKYGGDVVIPSDFTALVAYGWAVYAIRSSNGRVRVNWGWHEWGEEKRGNQQGVSTTERHMRLVERKAGPTAILSEDNPQIADAPDSVRQVCNPRARGMLR